MSATVCRHCGEPIEQRIGKERSIWIHESGYFSCEHGRRSSLAEPAPVVVPHEHKPVQHRDGKPPWCRECGLTAGMAIPVSRLHGSVVAPEPETCKESAEILTSPGDVESSVARQERKTQGHNAEALHDAGESVMEILENLPEPDTGETLAEYRQVGQQMAQTLPEGGLKRLSELEPDGFRITDRLEATIDPLRTDDLKPEILPFLGRRFSWYYGFRFDPGDGPFGGQAVWLIDDEVHPRGEDRPHGWVPTEDLADIVRDGKAVVNPYRDLWNTPESRGRYRKAVELVETRLDSVDWITSGGVPVNADRSRDLVNGRPVEEIPPDHILWNALKAQDVYLLDYDDGDGDHYTHVCIDGTADLVPIAQAVWDAAVRATAESCARIAENAKKLRSVINASVLTSELVDQSPEEIAAAIRAEYGTKEN